MGDIDKFKDELIAQIYNNMIDYSWGASYGEGYAIEDALKSGGFSDMAEIDFLFMILYESYQAVYNTLYVNKEFDVIEHYKEDFISHEVKFKDINAVKRYEYTDKVRTGSVKKISDILSVDVPYRKKSWLTYQRPERIRKSSVNIEVLAFLNDFLTNYNINAKYDIKFNQLKNASVEEGFIERGDTDVDIIFRTYSGVRVRASLTVPIRDSKLVEPSTLFIDGNMRILSQTTLDDIIKSKSFTRNMFKSPEDIVSADMVKTYLNTSMPYIDFGVYDGNE